MRLFGKLFRRDPWAGVTHPIAFVHNFRGPDVYATPFTGKEGVVFEDNGRTACFYASGRRPGQLLDGAHIYNAGTREALEPSEQFVIIWDPRTRRAGFYYRDTVRAVLDFRRKRAVSRTGLPPLRGDNRWALGGHAWDDSYAERLMPINGFVPDTLYADWMERTRHELARLRRSGAWPVAELLMPQPQWMIESGDTGFDEFYRMQETLLRDGHAVWGHVIEANDLLFEPGEFDLPAGVIWSLDPLAVSRVSLLENAALALSAMKGQHIEDEEVQAFVDVLDDEIGAPLRIDVPSRLTGGIPARFTVTIAGRKHLPEGVLGFGPCPLLVCPDQTDAVMILPSLAWPGPFREVWDTRARSCSRDRVTDERQEGDNAILPALAATVRSAALPALLLTLVVPPKKRVPREHRFTNRWAATLLGAAIGAILAIRVCAEIREAEFWPVLAITVASCAAIANILISLDVKEGSRAALNGGSVVKNVLVLLAVLLFWAPLVGLPVTAVAVMMNYRVGGWQRYCSLAALIVNVPISILGLLALFMAPST